MIIIYGISKRSLLPNTNSSTTLGITAVDGCKVVRSDYQMPPDLRRKFLGLVSYRPTVLDALTKINATHADAWRKQLLDTLRQHRVPAPDPNEPVLVGLFYSEDLLGEVPEWMPYNLNTSYGVDLSLWTDGSGSAPREAIRWNVLLHALHTRFHSSTWRFAKNVRQLSSAVPVSYSAMQAIQDTLASAWNYRATISPALIAYQLDHPQIRQMSGEYISDYDHLDQEGDTTKLITTIARHGITLDYVLRYIDFYETG